MPTVPLFQKKRLLLGECKWGPSDVGRDVLRELVEVKTSLVRRALPNEGKGWNVNYSFFARSGFTQAAQDFAGAHQALLIDLARLDDYLKE